MRFIRALILVVVLAATAEAQTYTVSGVASPVAGGSVSPSYATGAVSSTLTITETAATGYAFVVWTATGSATLTSSTATTTTLTISSANTTFTASFTPINYHVEVLSLPAAGGTMSAGSSTGTLGQTISITESPATGYVFAGWTTTAGTLAGILTPTASLTIAGGGTLTANFMVARAAPSLPAAPADYTVTLSTINATLTAPLFTTATSTSVTVTDSSTVILAANAARTMAVICNTSSTATIYMSFSNSATVGLGVPIGPGGNYQIDRNNRSVTILSGKCATGQSAVLLATEGQ